jgi:glycyl-tRNA synthetase beta chain
VAGAVPASRSSERGPRRSAPEQALAGFLRKHAATRDDLREEGDFWVLDKIVPGIDAAALVAAAVPAVLRKFPWPKSMRWGGSSGFTWVRPLRRITCLLDGAVVAFDLRDGEDDGHGLASGDLTEGHRFLSPGAFAVTGCADWALKLAARHVIVNAAERRAAIDAGLKSLAAAEGLTIVEDAGLLDEVTGLVEWPVPYLGRIDEAYMDLPAEVMQVSMRVNQRYFAVCDAAGKAAARFAFIANIPPTDGGAAMVAGNERVLRARFADARHFWDLDRKSTLESRVAALDKVTFHAKLGSQGDRVRRLVRLAGVLAAFTGADRAQAERAALLAKADLTTGLVGEFPEVQGIMGGYYARHDGEDPVVADAIADHYAPKGPGDAVPRNPVGLAAAMADKLDQLAGFFAIGEKPTGSGDPYALRRAALGVIRIIRERGLRLPLRALIAAAGAGQPTDLDVEDVLGFLIERLRVQLRTEGARYDVLNAVLGTALDDDLTRLLARTGAVAAMLATEDGANLLAGYKRAANILRIEEKKDGPHDRAVDTALLEAAEEIALAAALDRAEPAVTQRLESEEFGPAMAEFAALRPQLDAFFTGVTVNDPRAAIRLNRLALLARVRAVMGRVADFARIEG